VSVQVHIGNIVDEMRIEVCDQHNDPERGVTKAECRICLLDAFERVAQLTADTIAREFRAYIKGDLRE
jgi:hypothetical protein